MDKRITHKDIMRLLNIGQSRAKMRFWQVRVFCGYTKYSILAMSDFERWLSWYNETTPKDRAAFYKERIEVIVN